MFCNTYLSELWVLILFASVLTSTLHADEKQMWVAFRGLRSLAFFSRRDETRLEVTSQIAEIVSRLHMSGTVAREISGKIRDGMGLLSTNRY